MQPAKSFIANCLLGRGGRGVFSNCKRKDSLRQSFRHALLFQHD